MKALVYTGPRTVEYQEFAKPKPLDGECLVQVDKVGLCGSDLHAWMGHDERRPAPLILGHEAAGWVIDPNTGAKSRRVSVNPLVSCMNCCACKEDRTNLCPDRQIISMPPREGAFGEYLTIPERNLVDVPDHIPLNQACLIEPLACGYHAIRLAQDLSFTPINKCNAVVLGGGAIGVGVALCLTLFGCESITICEPNSLRHPGLLKLANVRVVKNLNEISTGDSSFDLVIDAYGGGVTRASASQAIRPGGLIMHVGLADGKEGLDTRRMTLQEVTFVGTYTYTMGDFKATAKALFEGKLGAMDWFEERPLAQGAKAFDDFASGKIAASKVVFTI